MTFVARMLISLAALATLSSAGGPSAYAHGSNPSQTGSDTPAATTSEGMPLHVDVFHLILNVVEPGFYQVAQVMSVRNVAEQAYLGGPISSDGRRAGLIIPLPVGAIEVHPLPPSQNDLDPSSLVLEEGRLLDLRAVPPGTLQAAISYELVAGPEGQEVEIALPYPTRTVSLLIGGAAFDAVQIEASQFVRQQPVSLGDKTFAQWTTEMLDAGSTVRFRVGPAASSLSAATWALLGLGISLLVAIAVSLFGGRRGINFEAQRQQIIHRIAFLDQRKEAGRISASDYFTQRGNALEQLLALERSPPPKTKPASSKQRGKGKGRRASRARGAPSEL